MPTISFHIFPIASLLILFSIIGESFSSNFSESATPRTVFGAHTVSFVYESTIIARDSGALYALSSGGYGVPNRESNPNCTDISSALLKYSVYNGKLIWGVCISTVTYAATFFVPLKETGYIGLASKDPLDATKVISVLVKTADGSVSDASLRSTFGSKEIGSPLYAVSHGNGLIFDANGQDGTIKTYPADKLVKFPTGKDTYVRGCTGYGGNFGPLAKTILCETEKSVVNPTSLPIPMFVNIDTKTGHITNTLSMHLLEGREEDFYQNVFFQAQHRFFFAASTIGLFRRRGAQSKTVALAKYDGKTLTRLWKKYISIVDASNTSFGVFAIPGSFGPDFVVVAVDLKHRDPKSPTPFIIGDDGPNQWQLIPKSFRPRGLAVIIISQKTKEIQNVFMVPTNSFSLTNGARQVHTTRDGTLIVRGNFNIFGNRSSRKKASFVSFPRVLCRPPLHKSKCCWNPLRLPAGVCKLVCSNGHGKLCRDKCYSKMNCAL